MTARKSSVGMLSTVCGSSFAVPGPARAPDAGGGDQDVHRAQRLDAATHHRVVRGLVGGVHLERQRAPPGAVHPARRLLGALQIEVGDTDVRALLRERERAGAPDAAATARDERDLPFETSGHLVGSFPRGGA